MQFKAKTLTKSDFEAMPQSNKEAKEIGSTRYFTGKPCNTCGQISFRYTKGHSCYTCSYLRGRERADEVSRRRYICKQWAVDYLGGKCQHCQNTFEHLSVYDTHHLDQTKKELSINSLYITINLENFKKKAIPELNKCILLCANCHRIEHSDPNSEFNKKHKNMLTRPQRGL